MITAVIAFFLVFAIRTIIFCTGTVIAKLRVALTLSVICATYTSTISLHENRRKGKRCGSAIVIVL